MIEKLKSAAVVAATFAFILIVCAVVVGSCAADMGFRWSL